MPTVELTKRFRFESSHVLRNPAWDDEKNYAIFGKCARPNGHGHNYELYVTIRGEVNMDDGMLYELKQLKELVNTHLIDKVDHFHLNYDVDFLEGIIPTAENLAIAFYNQLESVLPDILHEVRLLETENNWAVYRGEE
ncbi:MAG: 6-carboxytetrahydropterin synthase [Candidatus Marinimicrobia bacterium]|nr:6-carboxytetrahydropterin synthase [Candidatus Neomarinimicrobiota bacterium]MCF7828411.1 6-carboxytetrahydropterin synthase [Candidatus Neomarinimicrobiota bacterium]MCF7880995.1 6-carboxytetrahydropterin synthase [Candidatus Neomarinimicrobiota bacterium]